MLVTAQPNVLKVLEITGLNDVFQVHELGGRTTDDLDPRPLPASPTRSPS